MVEFGQNDPVAFGQADKKEEASPVTSFLRGANVGATEGGGTVAGAYVGGTYGSALGPWGTAAGALLGGAAGYLGGRMARKGLSAVRGPGGTPLAYMNTEELPPQDRPFAVAGEAVGGSVPFAGLPFAAGTREPASKILQTIISTARTSPKSFMAVEGVGIGGSAVGAGIAERMFPGSTPARMAGETVGGIAAPGRIVLSGSREGIKAARRVWSSFSTAGRQQRAAALMQDILREHGEDPEAVAAALREEPWLDLPMPPSVQAQSMTLLAIENTLRKRNPQLDASLRDLTTDTLNRMRQSIDLMTLSGDPAALRAASLERKRYFDILLNNRVQTAEREAAAVAGRIPVGRSRAEASRAMDEALKGALTDARGQERTLWGAVDRNMNAEPSAVFDAYDGLKGEILKEEALPHIIEGWVRRHRETQEDGTTLIMPTTTGELVRLRSRFLELAREASDKNEWSNARAYGEIAEAVLDDLDSAFGQAGDSAYDSARQFSHSLHDAFTRTFAGAALDTGPHGRRRVPPELMGARAFAGQREAGGLRFREMREATRLVEDPAAGADSNYGRMLSAQEDFLRQAAAETIDPVTQRVNERALAAFRARNADLLAEFPETMGLLADAGRAESALANIQGTVNQATRIINREAAFVRLTGADTPEIAIRGILSSKTPMKGMGQLARMARRDGIEAQDGFKAAIFQHAMTQATDRQGNFHFPVFKEAINKKIGGQSLLQFMQREKLITPEHRQLINQALDKAVQVQAFAGDPRVVNELIDSADGMSDLVLRIAGANLGSMGAVGQTTGAPFVAAAAGSRYLRQVFDKIPAGRTQDVMIEAMTNPGLLDKLLTTPVVPGQGISLGLQVNAALWNAGILEPLDELPEF